MNNPVYQNILDKKAKQHKAFAVLIDPDKLDVVNLQKTIDLAVQFKIDFIFVGGSLVVTDTLDQVVFQIKEACDIPVVLFPGSPDQITPRADALLYLSLISGRNPELLIGQHVISAPFVKQSTFKMGMQFIETLEIKHNGTVMVIGEIQKLIINDSAMVDDDIDLQASNSVGISGLNSYYALKKIAQFPYARIEELPKF